MRSSHVEHMHLGRCHGNRAVVRKRGLPDKNSYQVAGSGMAARQ